MIHRTRRGQRGVVLLSVLLILSLLTALIYQLVARHSLLIAQARQTFAGDQAMSYALGAESFARQLLYADWNDTGKGLDTLQESWAQPLEPFEIENGFLEIQIQDLNSCFNLNSILTTSDRPDQSEAGDQVEEGAQVNAEERGGTSTAGNMQRFKLLLRNQNIPDSVADAWIDWIDSDEQITGFGAEDGDYLLHSKPYRSANRAAGHLSELALLKDIEPQYVDILQGLACVLPSTELKININTAPAALLAAMSPSLSESHMLGLTEGVREYSNVNEITAEYPELAIAVDALSVTSEYFEVRIRAQVDDSLVEMASIIHRSNEDGAMTLIMRDLGKEFRTRFVEDNTQNKPEESS